MCNNLTFVFSNIQAYYFIQPNVNGLTIINDILEQTKHIDTTSVGNESSEEVKHKKDKNSILPDVTTIDTVKNEEINDGLELPTMNKPNPEKVIPIYTPDNVFVKVFMTHSSEKSALGLASFAQGFQKQVEIWNNYSPDWKLY